MAAPVLAVILTRHHRCPHKGGRDMLGVWVRIVVRHSLANAAG